MVLSGETWMENVSTNHVMAHCGSSVGLTSSLTSLSLTVRIDMTVWGEEDSAPR